MTGYKRKCPRCHKLVGTWQLQPFDRYYYHLKPLWRLWALCWWNRQLSWCLEGFKQVEYLEPPCPRCGGVGRTDRPTLTGRGPCPQCCGHDETGGDA